MTATPLVSVVVPVYNGAAYLAEALASVLAQTYRPLELIVVDDGSTDGTADVVKAFASPAMVALYQPNGGTGAARNLGVEAARGPLIAHLDADDRWHPDKLGAQVAELAAHDEIDLVSGGVSEFYSEDLSAEDRRRLRPPRTLAASYPMSAVLHRREVVARAGAWPTARHLGQDLDWHLRALEAGVTMRALPQVVAYRRLHLDNKNLRLASHASDRLHVLKAALDRRRRRTDGAER